MTYDECVDWLKTAEPGDRMIYHVGSLCFDRTFSPTLDMVADFLLGAAGYRFVPDGHKTMRWLELEPARCHLLQSKVTAVNTKGWPTFAYIAIKR